ncbi:MAG TPA: DinB family protein [Gemmatimonadales bacterium]
MNSVPVLPPLFSHLFWADTRAIESLRRAPDAARARALMAHVLGAEATWLARIEGRESELAVWPELSVEACVAASARIRAGYESLLARLDAEPGGLERIVHYRNSAGLEFDGRIADILCHVALHGAYHRGQVALLCREAGVAPEPTDYIAWSRGAPAATRRP